MSLIEIKNQLIDLYLDLKIRKSEEVKFPNKNRQIIQKKHN